MAKMTLCIYGRSGTFKTTQIGFISQYIYEKTGKPTHLVSADGGGWRVIQPYIDAGLIEPYSILSEENPIFVMGKLCQGYWPVNLQNGRRQTNKFYPPDKVVGNEGARIYEGITSISDVYMKHLEGKKLGINPAYSIRLTNSGEVITTSSQGDLKDKPFIYASLVDEAGKALSEEIAGGASQDHYGFVQSRIVEHVLLSWQIPVELVMWTAHEAIGEDEQSKNVYGPALAGKKGTPKIGRNVGVLLHCEPVGEIRIVDTKPATPGSKVAQKEVELAEVRYYFVPHPHKIIPKAVWDCKSRVPAPQMPELLKKYPEGYLVPEFTKGLDEYLRIEDDLLAKGTNSILEWKNKIDAETAK